jgi:cell division transport system ATP-binding protein
MDLFVQFNRVGTTVVVATHDVTLTAEFGLPTLGLIDGRLERDDL